MPKAQVMTHPTLTSPEKIVAAYASNVWETIQVFGGAFFARSGEISYREGEN